MLDSFYIFLTKRRGRFAPMRVQLDVLSNVVSPDSDIVPLFGSPPTQAPFTVKIAPDCVKLSGVMGDIPTGWKHRAWLHEEHPTINLELSFPGCQEESVTPSH
jgi:hypothetical protein